MSYVKFGSALLVIALAGCIWNIDKPAPDGWTYHTGNGATKDEIKSAFLECGFPVPGDFRDFPQEILSQLGYESGDSKKRYEVIAENYYCMKNAGFPMGRLSDPCKATNGLYRVCQPGAVIPVRSVETRLNSPFCKLYPKADLCQPGYDPKAPKPKSPAQ